MPFIILSTVHSGGRIAICITNFALPPEVFQEMTGGKKKIKPGERIEYDVPYKNWVKFCGMYFRFPSEEFVDDLYWDDDYAGQNIETWFRKKYSGQYINRSKTERYHFAIETAKSVIRKNPMISRALPFEEYLKLQKAGKHIPSHAGAYDPIESATIADIREGMEGNMEELFRAASDH